MNQKNIELINVPAPHARLPFEHYRRGRIKLRPQKQFGAVVPRAYLSHVPKGLHHPPPQPFPPRLWGCNLRANKFRNYGKWYKMIQKNIEWCPEQRPTRTRTRWFRARSVVLFHGRRAPRTPSHCRHRYRRCAIWGRGNKTDKIGNLASHLFIGR